jgi:tetratricopeptide (TPR) repeat protein
MRSCFAVVALLVWPRAVLAEEPDADRKADAARLLEAGNTRFARAEYTEALARYRQAFEKYPSPRLFFSMARAHDRLGNERAAAEHYERFLIEGGVATDSQLHATALQRLSVLNNDLGRLRLLSDVPGATAMIDGGDPTVTLPNRPLYLKPGRHHVRVELDGYAPFEGSVLVKARLISELKVDLPRIRAIAALAETPSALLPSPVCEAEPVLIERPITRTAVSRAEEDGGSSWWLWAALGVAAAAAGTAATIVLVRESHGGGPPPELGSTRLADWERR